MYAVRCVHRQDACVPLARIGRIASRERRAFRRRSIARLIETHISWVLLDGVHAEVVFPNALLCIGSRPEVDLNYAVAQAYNDWVHEVFSPEPERYVAAAFVPVDDVSLAVAEAQRCIAKGFRTVMVPCSYPWRPYDRPDYEPLWSLIEEAGVVLNFHVFTGNAAVPYSGLPKPPPAAGTLAANADFVARSSYAQQGS